MHSLYSLLILFFSLFLLFSTVIAFNITQILSDKSDFSNFNDALTQTKLAAEINSRRTITVLVVANNELSALSGQSTETVRKILSIHVILDYFDEDRFKSLTNKTSTLTTLYQSSGLSRGQEGFLNVTEQDEEVVLGSAAQGSSMDTTVVKSVFLQPFNISVLQISDPIIPGSSGSGSSPSNPPSPSPARPPARAPSPSNGRAPAPARAPSPAKSPAGSPEPSASDTPAMAPGSPMATPPGGNGPVADMAPSNEERHAGFAIVGKDNSLSMVFVALTSAWVLATMI
ncbi:Fasciclin-like arabinogalactan protein 14 [Euphorbia peplus]|nr:Fasciclin-like arabinogalactan protein 14 [Euphorbia peplus]